MTPSRRWAGVVLFAWWTGGSPGVAAESLVRDRLLAMPITETWSRVLALAAASDAIVHVLDEHACLVGLTVPVSSRDVRQTVVEEDDKDVSDRTQLAHLVVWAASLSDGRTRLRVRAAIGSGGVFLHSNGMLEGELLDAIEAGRPWRPSKSLGTLVQVTGEEARRRLTGLVTGGTLANVDDVTRGLLTLSLSIPSDRLQALTSTKVSGFYPGSAHLTIWTAAQGSRTTVNVRTLLIESGAFVAPALPSRGVLEAHVLNTLRAGPVSFPNGVPREPAPDFWYALFKVTPASTQDIRDNGTALSFPAAPDTVWSAAVGTVTQVAVLAASDRHRGTFSYVVAHPASASARYVAHRITLLIEPTLTGSRVVAYGGVTDEPSRVRQLEEREVLERIATQLFLKERLPWLLRK